MAVIKKKMWPEYYEPIASGRKKYDLRLNDFAVSEGDVLILEEWDPATNSYTGRSIEKNITYVRTFKIDELYWSKEEIMDKGIVVVSMN